MEARPGARFNRYATYVFQCRYLYGVGRNTKVLPKQKVITSKVGLDVGRLPRGRFVGFLGGRYALNALHSQREI